MTLGTWFSGTIATVTGEQTMALSGMTAVQAPTTTSAIILLGAFALTTARLRVARMTLAVIAVVSLLGVGTAVAAALNAEELLLEHITGAGEITGQVAVSFMLYICIAALLAACGTAILGFVQAPSWNYSRTRFDADRAESSDPRVRAMDDWDALSAGEDPTGDTR